MKKDDTSFHETSMKIFDVIQSELIDDVIIRRDKGFSIEYLSQDYEQIFFNDVVCSIYKPGNLISEIVVNFSFNDRKPFVGNIVITSDSIYSQSSLAWFKDELLLEKKLIDIFIKLNNEKK